MPRLLSLISLFFILSKFCTASTQTVGQISPPFMGAQMNWVDNGGLFLISKNRIFALGFFPIQGDVTQFLLGVVHIASSRAVWTANRGSTVRNEDKFVFDNDGNAYLKSGINTVWTTNTSGRGAVAMELQDSGNLAVLSNNSDPLWQSFNHPTNTLLSWQNFTSGMKLGSSSDSYNISYHLEINSGDLLFFADFKTPQPYWSMQKDSRQIINKVDGNIAYATLESNTWRAYNQNQVLLWQFKFSENTNPNLTWAAILSEKGLLSFYNLFNEGSENVESITIPQDPCHTPEPCGPYYICQSSSHCQCPPALSSINCRPDIGSLCSSKGRLELVSVGDGLDYFATGFVPPLGKSNLTNCKDMCIANCSCNAMFFDVKSQNCFLFEEIGSLQQPRNNKSGYISFVKVLSKENGQGISDDKGSSKQHILIVVVLVVVTLVVIGSLMYVGCVYYKKRKSTPELLEDSTEEENFLAELSNMPVRFSYKELQTATTNFAEKLGQGGFGSVYHGVLLDGTHIAVKKLEGIGQGKKEFRAEVSIIGSIHHLHLVRLRGFCIEGSHRLLAYEYMAKGSLEKWIFPRNERDQVLLDWDRRFEIALATAKGLAYLHEDCNVKIVHCDIKPENVLLDDNFVAKVSDFGLAKLMTREQSHVFTTLRGTRGYLAPEWIMNYAISEKSDVYSFGMVLLEIIGGRKNFDPLQVSEKAHFPTYTLKKMEEGKLKEIFDPKLKFDEEDERITIAIKVALWCIQEDMHLRPPMTRVVQMLEGLCEVPEPPSSHQIGSRLYLNFLKTISEDGTTSGPSDCNNGVYLSEVGLSGPR